MPYQIKPEDGKFCVYNLTSKKKEGEFDTRAQAMSKMKALYAADKKNPKSDKESAAEDASENGEEDD